MAIPTWVWGAAGLMALSLALSSNESVPARWQLLNTLHPQARFRFVALCHAIERLGWTVVLTSAYRPGLHDAHNFGLAIDVNVRRGERWLKMASPKAEWDATGIPQLIRAAGFRWGGDFTTPYVYQGKTHPGYDPVHIDLLNRYSAATLRSHAARLGLTDGRRVPLTA